MAEKKYNIIKAASWYTVGNILVKGASFFVLPIFTSLMNTHEYGIYSVYTSYLAIFEVVSLLGFSSTVNIAKYTDGLDFKKYMGTISVIPIALGVFCLLFLNIYLSSISTLLSMDRILWNCLVITAVSGGIAQIIGAELIIEGEYKKYMAYSLLATLGNIVLSLLLCFTVYRSHDVYMARVIGNTISAILSTVYIIVITRTQLRIEREYIGTALMWGIPLLFHTLATVVLTQSDRIMIRYMDSYSSTGIYAIATTLIIIPTVLETSFSQAWTPWFYEKLQNKDYESIQRLNDKYIIAFAFVIAMFMLVSPDVVHIFTNENYWSSVLSLLPLTISVFGEFMYSIPTSVEYFNKKTTYIMVATLITVVINIALNYVFISMIGYMGAAFATAVSKTILYLIHSRFAHKIDENNLFHNRVVISSFAVLTGYCIILYSFYDNSLLRYSIVAITLILAGIWFYKNLNFIKKMVKR